MLTSQQASRRKHGGSIKRKNDVLADEPATMSASLKGHRLYQVPGQAVKSRSRQYTDITSQQVSRPSGQSGSTPANADLASVSNTPTQLMPINTNSTSRNNLNSEPSMADESRPPNMFFNEQPVGMPAGVNNSNHMMLVEHNSMRERSQRMSSG